MDRHTSFPVVLAAAGAEQSDQPDFAIRGFEICSNDRFQTAMWRWNALERSFRMMEDLKFNTLIFHQNTLTDWVVLPRAYFPTKMMHARWPVRLAQVENGKSHISEVAKRAADKGIRFFLEVKEMSYPEELVELHPELMVTKGVVCPTHPFWWEFMRAKYQELVEDIPDIGGVLVSPGTRESKLSLSVHNCTCDRCRSYDPSVWYKNILQSMYEPLQAKGKLLVVRDFAYSRTEQNLILDACSSVSKDIAVTLKNTPHDFYPPFPDNPRIGHMGDHPQWIEFDTWGNYYAFGFFPVSVVEDMQRRLRYAKKNKAIGAMFRVDLEFISDGSDFNSWDLVNVFGAGMLSQEIEQDLDNVYRAWLAYGVADHLIAESEQPAPVPVPPAYLPQFRDFMRASWAVMEKTLYVRGHVFNDGGCQFPFSIKRAFDNMYIFQGREDWEPGSLKRVEATAENLKIIFAEKEQAEREVALLPEILKLEETPLPAGLKASMREVLDLYQRYVQGFKYCAVACFTTKKAMNTHDAADIAAALRTADEVDAYRQEAARRLEGTYYPHYVYWFLPLDYLDRLTADVREKMTAIQAIGTPVANRT